MNLKPYLVGAAIASAVFVALNAIGQVGQSINVGRYQAVAVPGTALFIVDTSTGQTKIVWSAVGGWMGQLGKSFTSMPDAPGR